MEKVEKYCLNRVLDFSFNFVCPNIFVYNINLNLKNELNDNDVAVKTSLFFSSFFINAACKIIEIAAFIFAGLCFCFISLISYKLIPNFTCFSILSASMPISIGLIYLVFHSTFFPMRNCYNNILFTMLKKMGKIKNAKFFFKSFEFFSMLTFEVVMNYVDVFIFLSSISLGIIASKFIFKYFNPDVTNIAIFNSIFIPVTLFIPFLLILFLMPLITCFLSILIKHNQRQLGIV